MNALGRWLLGVKAGDVPATPRTLVLPDLNPAHPILCECGSDQPMASVVLLRSYALRAGKLESEVTGERVSCQACGNVFSIGPHGRFKHDPHALPVTMSPPRPDAFGPNNRPQPEGPPIPERPPLLPTPLQRPRV